MAQTANDDAVTQEQQSTDTPAWDSSKKSDDEKTDSSKNNQNSYDFQKSGDDQKAKDDEKTESSKQDQQSNDIQKPDDDQKSKDDATDAPTNAWTPAPQGSNENTWNQPPASSWESSGKSDDDNSENSPSSGIGQLTPASASSGTSDDNNNDDNDTGDSSKPTETSESNGDSWKQEPVSSSEGSQTTGTTSSAGSQTTAGGGGSSTPSSGGGKVPDGTWPTSTGSVKLTAPQIIKAGETFDGKMQTFDRSDITCSEGEGQKDTAVFLVEAGGTLKNAIIGKNQKEGVHCDDHDCTIENVWWDDVCEDALSIKGGSASSVTTVTNCGARSASDKVVQHNGQGTVNIDGFYAETFGKLYRSCGTCGDIPRKVTVKNVYAVDPLVSVITVNKNYGDQATLSNIWVKTSKGGNDVKVCQWSQGGDNPSNLGDGPSPPLCQYSESDVHINQDVSQAGGSSPSTPSTPTKSSDGSNTSQTEWTQPPSTSSDNDDGGSGESTDVPAPSSTGSQTDQDPVVSSESSGNNDNNGSNENPSVSSGGSQTGGTTPSIGSQTTGGSTIPSSGGGKVPDGTWPTSTGTVQLAAAQTIKAGETFDGKMQTFERSDITCEGQTESGADTAVFMMEPGSTLKNVIIGKNQMEGVHCDKHDCTLENVWWDDVCEDAFSVKGGTASSVTTVTGGGARSADDKVIQHNGYGTVKIDGFYGEDISKLYRSCGTCGDRPKKVSVSNVYIVNPENAVVTVNKNWGDEATLSNIWVKSSGKKKVKICQWSQGNADGEPSMLGDGPSPPLCQYSESDVHINGDISQAGGGSTPSTGSGGATPSGGSDSPEQSSGGNDEGGSSTEQNQWTQSSSTSSNHGDENNNGNGDDNGVADPAGGDSEETPSKSSDDKNGDGSKSKDDNKESESSKTNDKSDGDNSDPTQQETTPDDQSVMQSDVAGEAETDSTTEETTLASPSTKKKCNVRRRKRD
ncbi:Pectate lyase [Phytophthora megakarya]|uniref:Probable pectate lyase F n=1 Tax=Phytophthora megakarya TaxID=4795 RepID=A0A225WI56_9STRA|nr:Pectate lyase [Phytophthora megakarya]